MHKFMNQVNVEGYLYQHTLEMKETGLKSKNPGTKYITGTVEIATDDAMLNIVPVHFTYVTETTSKGNPNRNWNVLKGIIEGTYNCIMEVGQESATKVKISTSIALNEFYTDRDGKEELVSAKRNEGGFIVVVNNMSENEVDRNKFIVEMLITGFRTVEGDPDKGTEDKGIIKGAVFDFKQSLLPIELSVYSPDAINYFESLEASATNPVIRKLWGQEISNTVVKRIVEESAFGGQDSVREVKNTRKDWVVTGAGVTEYEFDSESTITALELKEAMANREVHLATIKKQQEEWKASRSNNTAAAAAPQNNIAAGGFKF